MNIEFWIPNTISVAAIVWSFMQSRIIERLKNEHAKQVLVSKLQFEKEFEVYKSTWTLLVELKSELRNFSPEFYEIHKNNPSSRKDLVKSFGLKCTEIYNAVELAKPFFSIEIYELLQKHILEVFKIFQWNTDHNPSYTPENWDLLSNKIKTALLTTEAIRRRISSLHAE